MEALDWLFQQFPSYQKIGSKAYKPTLENTEKILAFLDNPQDSLKFIHIAGSNGKGSVSSYLASILKEHGLKVGLFTSPHIAHFSERIRINGTPIENDEIDSFVATIRAQEFDFSPSFFEVTFGMALKHFQANNCDICVIETGLGGRLDATNVITPEISAITTISLEHTQILGDTLEEIAIEKAGIIKKNVPVVFGAGCKVVMGTLKNCAANKSAQIHHTSPLSKSFASIFRAAYQQENAATALKVIEVLYPEVSHKDIENGFKNLRKNSGYYGRLQQMETSPEVLFDVSHNADGIKSTIETVLNSCRGNLHVIYGTSNDKDLLSIAAIFPNELHFLATEFTNERSAKIKQLRSGFGEKPFKSTRYFGNPIDAMKAAKTDASEADTILVIGSFFLLSNFF